MQGVSKADSTALIRVAAQSVRSELTDYLKCRGFSGIE